MSILRESGNKRVYAASSIRLSTVNGVADVPVQ